MVSSFSRPASNGPAYAGCGVAGLAAGIVLSVAFAYRDAVFGNSKPMDGVDFENEAKTFVVVVESGTRNIKRRGCVEGCSGLKRMFGELKNKVLEFKHEATKKKLEEEGDQQEPEDSKKPEERENGKPSLEEDPEGEQTE